MKVQIESSRVIKPCYEASPPPPTTYTALSVFDEFTYDAHVGSIYAYSPPTPSNAALELGLQKVLAIYREWAGRFCVTDEGIYSICQNDEGVKFIEASADCKFDEIMPLDPFKVSESNLHASIKVKDDLLQIQLTRFTCGTLVVGLTTYHRVADGQATIDFLVAWGQASRGVTLNPFPLRDRTIFPPREPPCIEFDHRRVEFTSKKPNYPPGVDRIIMHDAHFTADFLSRIKAQAQSTSTMSGEKKLHTTFESLLAHLWRSITLARQLGGDETTNVRISVNGRRRVNPRVPDEYFGNLVLWATPEAKVKDLLDEPLSYTSKLIHDAVTKIDNNYFKSYIDFASNEAKREGLISTANTDKKSFLCPNVEVHSWLRFPFYEVDFGSGSPFFFMPSEALVEGLIFLAPTFLKDGSIVAFVALYEKDLAAFKQICYSLD